MSGYHRFVFDTDRRRLIGAFEEMYRAEDIEGFDSWHQDDTRLIAKQVSLAVLGNYTFGRVLDVGCGKGAFTGLLKRANNEVVAVDVSETALAVARRRYPDIDVRLLALRAPFPVLSGLRPPFDLVSCLETLSYLENWAALLEEFAAIARFVLIALYLPPDPIGAVKSFDHLKTVFERLFAVVHDIRLVPQSQIVLYGESRVARPA